jgi:7,8-dihydropterin-6-yl-methyl-4-(beta-D-ribofuranosyl)aminobenzene 5'-phosphate synthase
MHLMVASPERIEKTARELKKLGLQRLGVSHCTGFNASAILARQFGEVLFLNSAGTQITVE